jgi:beta-lactam-binding protein with PASTA domain
VVLTQSPPPGRRIDVRVSVTVTIGPPQAPVGARVRRATPPALSAEAHDEVAAGEQPPMGDRAEEY